MSGVNLTFFFSSHLQAEKHHFFSSHLQAEKHHFFSSHLQAEKHHFFSSHLQVEKHHFLNIMYITINSIFILTQFSIFFKTKYVKNKFLFYFLIIYFKHCHERLRRKFNTTHLSHSLLSFFLFF